MTGVSPYSAELTTQSPSQSHEMILREVHGSRSLSKHLSGQTVSDLMYLQDRKRSVTGAQTDQSVGGACSEPVCGPKARPQVPTSVCARRPRHTDVRHRREAAGLKALIHGRKNAHTELSQGLDDLMPLLPSYGPRIKTDIYLTIES